MLIICENHHGDTPQTALPVRVYRWHANRYAGVIKYVAHTGDGMLPPGVYRQRYYVWGGEESPQYAVHTPYEPTLADLVQESTNADHPQDQPERRAT
jgi:hypothetical protein